MLYDFIKDQDVYIKDEGYAAVKFLSDKAKEIADSLGIPNHLQEIGDTSACGNPIWSKNTKKGMYECSFDLCEINKIIQVLTSKGLKVESEI